MKKLLLALAGIAFVAGSAVAQDYEKNIFGVRAGMNVANMSAQGLSANSKIGFHVAGVYQRLLSSSMPLYLETGLQFTQKGCKFDYANEEDSSSMKLNALYLEIPVMVNYKFRIKDVATVYPSVGVYYAFGLGGKYKNGESFDSFGDKGCLKRSDFGMRISGTVDWHRFSFGLGYEFGFSNVGKDAEAMETMGAKIKTNNLFISVGYNF